MRNQNRRCWKCDAGINHLPSRVRYCPEHRPTTRQYNQTYRQRAISNQRCVACSAMLPPGYDKHTCPNCLDRQSNWHMKYAQDVKESVLNAYGRSCICCGEIEAIFLCVDHIDGGGNKHRQLTLGGKNRAGIPFYSWLVKQNFPAGFQILCWNCNSAKHILGICPHQSECSPAIV